MEYNFSEEKHRPAPKEKRTTATKDSKTKQQNRFCSLDQNGKLILKFPYNKILLGQLKSLPSDNRFWNAEQKQW